MEDGVLLAEVRKRMDAEGASLFQQRKQHASNLLASLAGQLILEKGRAVGHGNILVNSNEIYQRYGLPPNFFNDHDTEQLKEALESWSRSVGYDLKIEYPYVQNPAQLYIWTATLTPAV